MMAPQNDPNIPASPSSLHSSSQSEHLSSKFLRKSKFLMKSNVNVESPDSCGTTSTNDLLPNLESSVPSPSTHQQPPSEMTAPVAGSDIKPITHPAAEIIMRTAQESKQATSSTPLSLENQSPTTPLMEIIPPPLSHRLQVTTPLESATPVASSDNDFVSTPELQSLTEIQYTPCRLYLS